MESTVNGKFDKLTAGKADSWRRRIDDQRGSGQSVRAWCKANDAREHSFYWWRRRLCLPRAGIGRTAGKQRPVEQAGAELAPNAFAQVILSAAAAPPAVSIVEPLRLRLAGDRELILPTSMPLEQVARLVRALEATA
jgi:hypothetical protein